jgi:hypothetical protein
MTTPKLLTVSTLLVVAVAAASLITVTQHKHTAAAPSAKPGIGAAVKSKFSSTGAEGWWQGATNKTSMALFQSTHDCFVSAEYKVGTVNAAGELQKTQSNMTKDGYVVSSVSTQSLTLQTTSGTRQYELQESNVVTPTNMGTQNKVQGGQEFGYVQLSNGYVKIMGYCNTANELPATIPALQSIKFNENN